MSKKDKDIKQLKKSTQVIHAGNLANPIFDEVSVPIFQITLAVSLGGVESLIEHPASMTHASIPQEERKVAGISDDLVRIAVGCEDYEDLRDDLAQALNKIV